jgi:hypothetical protein
MKKILILCTFTVAVITVIVWRVAAQPSRFGTFTSAPKAEVVRLIAEPESFLGKTVEIEGTISEQCRTMGCFFFFRSGHDTLRVDLQEVAMKAPIREGRAARVEGQMVPYNGGYQFYASAVEFE